MFKDRQYNRVVGLHSDIVGRLVAKIQKCGPGRCDTCQVSCLSTLYRKYILFPLSGLTSGKLLSRLFPQF